MFDRTDETSSMSWFICVPIAVALATLGSGVHSASPPPPSPIPTPRAAPAPTPPPILGPGTVQVVIAPSVTSVPIEQKILVSVEVNNATDKTVTLSLQEGSAGGSVVASTVYGTVAQGGPQWVYTAPTTPGTYHLVATPRADPRRPVRLALNVQAPLAGCTVAAAKIGVWENITPSQVDLTAGDWFGMQAMVVDPTTTSTLYVGRAMEGVYKSLDCGTTWFKVSTGRNSGVMATGRTWSMVIDPSNPQVLYAPQGYGQSGVFKTTNGGVDWDQILTSNITSVAPYGGFVGGIAMNPGRPSHLLVSWHAECSAPYTKACYAETQDSGASWTMRNGDPSWAGGEGTRFDIVDANTWLFNSESNGMWVSLNQGTSWTKINGVGGAHAGGQIYRAIDGKLYMGSAGGVIVSADNARTWSVMPNSGALVFGVIGDGTTLYTSAYFPYNPPGVAPWRPYAATSETTPGTWRTLVSPLMKNGGPMAYDPVHRIIYSTNLNAGIWRMVVR